MAGDGVVGATGARRRAPVACYAQDGVVPRRLARRGHADTIVRVLETAGRARVPVVGFVESGGARMQEGIAALAGYGRIFREHGRAVGRRAADLGRLGRIGRRRRVLAGADRLRDDRGRGDVPDRARASSARRSARRSTPPRSAARACTSATASATSSRATRPSAAARVRDLLDYLPSAAGEPLPLALARRAAELARPGRARARRAAARLRRPRRAARRSSTAARCSSSARAGRATWSARSRGSTAARSAIVANQPRYLGGVLDAEASQKAARFVGFCNSFGLPLIVLVDTPGFMPGSRQEQAGVIRHGA